jgi:hypothetical protein
VTTTATDRATGISVYVLYPHLYYDIDRMRAYFAAIAAVWRSSEGVTYYLSTGERLPTVRVPDTRRSYDDPDPRPEQLTLRVHRLTINSPMEITFAVEGGAVAIATYTTYLFARVLRSPEQIGSWLPRLAAGWHQGMRQAEIQKEARKIPQQNAGDDDNTLPIPEQLPWSPELAKAARQLVLLKMKAEAVTTIGLDDVPTI